MESRYVLDQMPVTGIKNPLKQAVARHWPGNSTPFVRNIIAETSKLI
ncbi:MAG: hypothetical protein GY730_07075 [bacterium]|nr:hypothetical protein [bacterium]